MDSIVKVFRYSDVHKDLAYLIAEVRITGPLQGSPRRFARKHGGDYIEVIDSDEFEDDDGVAVSNWRNDAIGGGNDE
jgi:hypothetical protein